MRRKGKWLSKIPILIHYVKEYSRMIMCYEASAGHAEAAEHSTRQLSMNITFFALLNLFVAFIAWFFKKYRRKTNQENS